MPVGIQAQDGDDLHDMQELDVQDRLLDMRERESHMDFKDQMRAMDLENRRFQMERERQPDRHMPPRGCPMQKHCGGLAVICIIIHLLLTIWVYGDIRQRGQGLGLWIIITLLAGFFGALLYLLARLGDRQLEAAGVCSSASRLLLLGAARGLQILMDRAIEAARAPH